MDENKISTVVEPDTKIANVFTLGENQGYGRPDLYSETDNIKVGIFEDLVVELDKVFDYE